MKRPGVPRLFPRAKPGGGLIPAKNAAKKDPVIAPADGISLGKGRGVPRFFPQGCPLPGKNAAKKDPVIALRTE